LAAVLVEELVALAVEVEHWLQCHVLVEPVLAGSNGLNRQR
jgi:hypothetical protein